MLNAVLDYLNNDFRIDDAEIVGEFNIEGGAISIPSLADGQYFKIEGSLFNDGVYLYPVTGLTDESFTGVVRPLRVPARVVSIAAEVKAWVEKNEPGAFTSESFGGYSYTRATDKNGGAVTWQNVFAKALRHWRRV